MRLPRRDCANLGTGRDGCMTEIFQHHDTPKPLIPKDSIPSRGLNQAAKIPLQNMARPQIAPLKGIDLMSKLIHTSTGALESHFERLATGRYRRRLRRRRSSRPTPGGSTPLKAA